MNFKIGERVKINTANGNDYEEGYVVKIETEFVKIVTDDDEVWVHIDDVKT